MKNRNCKVTIDRGGANVDHFESWILGETTTHFLVGHKSNSEGEWLPKQSAATHITPFN